MSTLEVHDLHAEVIVDDGEAVPILKGVNLQIGAGEVHAVMGPNGSGKSTLASCIAGHPKYRVTRGSVTLDGKDLLTMPVNERAKAGIFLAMQYPVEVPGVSSANFLRSAAAALTGNQPRLREWIKTVNQAMGKLEMDAAFGQRDLNVGWSGGEKKRHEILQLEVLKPKIALLDETDSGLDVDALRIVSAGINRSVEAGLGALVITHYNRILRYVRPDHVHVFSAGRIIESGDARLAEKLEQDGYGAYDPVSARVDDSPTNKASREATRTAS